jgi:hypothetical protein
MMPSVKHDEVRRFKLLPLSWQGMFWSWYAWRCGDRLLVCAPCANTTSASTSVRISCILFCYSLQVGSLDMRYAKSDYKFLHCICGPVTDTTLVSRPSEAVMPRSIGILYSTCRSIITEISQRQRLYALRLCIRKMPRSNARWSMAVD